MEYGYVVPLHISALFPSSFAFLSPQGGWRSLMGQLCGHRNWVKHRVNWAYWSELVSKFFQSSWNKWAKLAKETFTHFDNRIKYWLVRDALPLNRWSFGQFSFDVNMFHLLFLLVEIRSRSLTILMDSQKPVSTGSSLGQVIRNMQSHCGLLVGEKQFMDMRKTKACQSAQMQIQLLCIALGSFLLG